MPKYTKSTNSTRERKRLVNSYETPKQQMKQHTASDTDQDINGSHITELDVFNGSLL